MQGSIRPSSRVLDHAGTPRNYRENSSPSWAKAHRLSMKTHVRQNLGMKVVPRPIYKRTALAWIGTARPPWTENLTDAVIKVSADMYNKGSTYRKRLRTGTRIPRDRDSTLRSRISIKTATCDPALAGGADTRIRSPKKTRDGVGDPARDLQLHAIATTRPETMLGDGRRIRPRTLRAYRGPALKSLSAPASAAPPDPDHHRRIPRPRLRLWCGGKITGARIRLPSCKRAGIQPYGHQGRDAPTASPMRSSHRPPTLQTAR
jgi:hypothetical protein